MEERDNAFELKKEWRTKSIMVNNFNLSSTIRTERNVRNDIAIGWNRVATKIRDNKREKKWIDMQWGKKWERRERK